MTTGQPKLSSSSVKALLDDYGLCQFDSRSWRLLGQPQCPLSIYKYSGNLNSGLHTCPGKYLYPVCHPSRPMCACSTWCSCITRLLGIVYTQLLSDWSCEYEDREANQCEPRENLFIWSRASERLWDKMKQSGRLPESFENAGWKWKRYRALRTILTPKNISLEKHSKACVALISSGHNVIWRVGKKTASASRRVK